MISLKLAPPDSPWNAAGVTLLGYQEKGRTSPKVADKVADPKTPLKLK